MKKLAAFLIALFLSANALAFSQSYQLTGNCNGLDMVYSWSINGAPGGGGAIPPPTSYGASFIYPFTASDITIVGAELVLIPPAPGAYQQPGWPAVGPGGYGGIAGPYMPAFSFLMIGNNAWGDAMLFMAANEIHAVKFFPPNTFKFNGTVTKTPLTYIDLHGSCTAGYAANVMLTIYYTIP